MAVALQTPESLIPVSGVRLAATAAGIRRSGKPDLTLIELAPGTRAAAVFTRNAFCAAPVTVARCHLAVAAPRYLLINAGNANAGTGAAGMEAAERSCAALAQAADCRAEEVLPFSTGVIGAPLPVERIEQALMGLHGALAGDAWPAAARAIMTTDTVPKGVSRRIETAQGGAVVTGIAKGAGMIRPDMATMLAFVATDAELAPELLRASLHAAVEESFHCITVDGDTSTNDACVLMATGAGTLALASTADSGYAAFQAALTEVLVELAQAIVRDAEGANKFVTLEVTGGRDAAECRRVAFTIAHSPLVKTAWFASDPNWGRVLAAVGRAGLDDLDITGVDVDLGSVRVVEGGALASGYTEHAGARAWAPAEITVRVALGRGSARARIWTCDLSYGYVRINAEYRT